MQKRVVTPPGSIAPLPGFSQAIVIELADCAIVHIAAELPQVAAIRGRYLADPPPTSTAVEITGLAVPGALIEIEAKAVIARG